MNSMKSILADVRLGFYNGSIDHTFGFSQDAATGSRADVEIKPISRFNFLVEASRRPVKLIVSVAITAFEAIRVLYKLIRYRDLNQALNESRFPEVSKLAAVNIVMITLSVAGILFPQTINEKVLRMNSNGISFSTAMVRESDRREKFEVAYEDDSYEHLYLKV